MQTGYNLVPQHTDVDARLNLSNNVKQWVCNNKLTQKLKPRKQFSFIHLFIHLYLLKTFDITHQKAARTEQDEKVV